MGKKITFLTYNVASSHHLSGVNQLIANFAPLFLFLQEVTINTTQINAIIDRNYKGECNLDPNDPRKPGTAVVWRSDIQVEVVNLITCRIQCLRVWGECFLNVYGFPGTQGQRARKILFGEELLNFLVAERHNLPILVGDWNAVVSPSDVSPKVFGDETRSTVNQNSSKSY